MPHAFRPETTLCRRDRSPSSDSARRRTTHRGHNRAGRRRFPRWVRHLTLTAPVGTDREHGTPCVRRVEVAAERDQAVLPTEPACDGVTTARTVASTATPATSVTTRFIDAPPIRSNAIAVPSAEVTAVMSGLAFAFGVQIAPQQLLLIYDGSDPLATGKTPSSARSGSSSSSSAPSPPAPRYTASQPHGTGIDA
jgi:hypothetical protein